MVMVIEIVLYMSRRGWFDMSRQTKNKDWGLNCGGELPESCDLWIADGITIQAAAGSQVVQLGLQVRSWVWGIVCYVIQFVLAIAYFIAKWQLKWQLMRCVLSLRCHFGLCCSELAIQCILWTVHTVSFRLLLKLKFCIISICHLLWTLQIAICALFLFAIFWIYAICKMNRRSYELTIYKFMFFTFLLI